MTEYVRAQWTRSIYGDLVFFPGGNIPVGLMASREVEEYCEENEIDIVKVPWRAYLLLKDWMVEKDPHRVVMTNRDEDIKVIHRLLDIIELGVKQDD